MSGHWPGTGDVRLCRTGMLHRRGDTIPGPRRCKVRSTSFLPSGENCVRFLASPLPNAPAPLGRIGNPVWPPIVPLPRNRLASSAAGGASPISPIFFGLRPKETLQRAFSPLRGSPWRDAPSQKKTAWAQNGAMRLICLKYGGPNKGAWWSRQDAALGAVLVLAISISLASGLRQKLTHSDARSLPTKTAPLGFRGGLETFGLQPRELELRGRARTERTSG